jgi:hypothetical protein
MESRSESLEISYLLVRPRLSRNLIAEEIESLFGSDQTPIHRLTNEFDSQDIIRSLMKRIHDGLNDRRKGIPIFLSLLDFHETLVRSFSKNTCTKSCKRRKLSNIFETHSVILSDCAGSPCGECHRHNRNHNLRANSRKRHSDQWQAKRLSEDNQRGNRSSLLLF